jgi:MFS transporter, MHS family, shikimate and dehydroshikimate transport protein
MTMSSPSVAVPRRTLIEVVAASTIGTTIEWYDFFVYGLLAALAFPALFFPEADPFTGQILALSTYSVGFVARPLGGFIFGAMGDRLGRRAALVTTLLLMGISTLLIGFLPVYATMGVMAPVLLVLLRFLQGLGVGGEWGGAVLMALEHGHSGRRGFYASWPQAGVPLGLIAATCVVELCYTLLGADAFLAWGWRIPFFLSGLLIAVGLVIRLRVLETPLFLALQAEQQVSKSPVRETLRHHWREVVLAAGVRLAENSCFYLFTVWVPAYGQKTLGVAPGVMLGAVTVAAAVVLISIPLFGHLSDRWSRRKASMAGCLFMIAFAWPFFLLLETRQIVAIYLAILLALAVGHAVLYSIQGSLIPELFDTRVRCTGASLGYQLSAPFGGGLAPLIAASLHQAIPGPPWPLAVYIIIVAAISLLCTQRLPETSRKQLDG